MRQAYPLDRRWEVVLQEELPQPQNDSCSQHSRRFCIALFYIFIILTLIGMWVAVSRSRSLFLVVFLGILTIGAFLLIICHIRSCATRQERIVAPVQRPEFAEDPMFTVMIRRNWLNLTNEQLQRERQQEIHEQLHRTLLQRTVQQLETIHYSSQMQLSEQIQENNCIICMEDYKENDLLSKLSCHHIFHQHCLLEWLQRKNRCPLCSIEIPLAPMNVNGPSVSSTTGVPTTASVNANNSDIVSDIVYLV
jgi:hypothetical protein